MLPDTQLRPVTHQQLHWINARSQLSDPSCEYDPVTVMQRYLHHGLAMDRLLDGPEREAHLFRMLDDLINRATDPLTPTVMVQLCLDNINRPSSLLRKLFRNNPQGLRKLDRIHHALTTLYNHCSRSC